MIGEPEREHIEARDVLLGLIRGAERPQGPQVPDHSQHQESLRLQESRRKFGITEDRAGLRAPFRESASRVTQGSAPTSPGMPCTSARSRSSCCGGIGRSGVLLCSLLWMPGHLFFPQDFGWPEGSDMAIRITDQTMTSDRTRHLAAYLADPAGPDDPQEPYWLVSWLPGRKLTRNEAVTAMMLAETTASGLEPGDRRWPHIDAWAAELGLTGPDAVVRASEPAEPEDDWYTSTDDPDRDRLEDTEMADVQACEGEAEA